MNASHTAHSGRKVLHKTWSFVTHLVDDVEPDRISTIAPMGADGHRTKPFSQN